MLIGSAVNIDSRGEVLTEVSARVVKGDDGKPRLEPMPDAKPRWLAVLSRHAGKGALRLVISRVSQRRSSAQNRLLWGVVYAQLLEGLKEKALEHNVKCPFRDDEDLHEAMKYRFLGVVVEPIPGTTQTIDKPATTTTLDMAQFSRYVGEIVALAATWDVYIEMPEAA